MLLIRRGLLKSGVARGAGMKLFPPKTSGKAPQADAPAVLTVPAALSRAAANWAEEIDR